MSKAHDVFEKAARKFLSAPERLLGLCMEQYRAREREREGRIRAEGLARERERINAAMSQQVREEREKHKKADEELGRYRKKYEEKTRKMEILRLEAGKIFEQFNRATEKISELKEQACLLRKRAEEAEAGRDTAKKEREEALAEAEMSQKEASRLQEQAGLHGKARFDSTTEKTANLFHGIDVEEDPLDEEAPADGSHNYSADEVIRHIGRMLEDAIGDSSGGDTGERDTAGKKKGKRPKKAGKREEELESVRLRRETCAYTQEELDRMFAGEADYKVYGGNRRIRFGRLRPAVYATEEYTPKVVVRDMEGRKKYVRTLPYKSTFFKRSKADPSLVVSCFYDKFNMGLPYNRLENEFESLGIKVNRQDMTHWTRRFCDSAFMVVRRRMMEELWKEGGVVHIDETTWRVVDWKGMTKDQKKKYIKKNGSKGFIWVMATGELSKGNQAVIYTYDPSRSTEVLKEHVEQGLKDILYIVCDAYSAYGCFARQFPGRFARCICWMHSRRKWSDAVCVLKPWMNKKLTRKEILDIPEIRGLLLANAVFVADTPLKSCSASERYQRRLAEVGPHVDRYFEYLRSIDVADEGCSEKLREAVNYSLNNEEALRVFLTNGNIPIDNGKAERLVKPLATTRKNSLFSFSQEGAENAAMIHSVIETAKANHADVYAYLKYVVTTMPDRPKGLTDDEYYKTFSKEFLDDMMPWSEKYHEFEKWHIENHIDEIMPESDELPKGIKGRKNTAA